MLKYVVHTDGASRGNPGDAAIAYVINQDNNLTEYCQAIGKTTNNQAEYQAMAAAVDKLVEMSIGDSHIEFYSDSELMVKQLLGEYRVKDANIRPIFDSIKAKLSNLEDQGNSYKLTAIRREFNKRADELANHALDHQST